MRSDVESQEAGEFELLMTFWDRNGDLWWESQIAAGSRMFRRMHLQTSWKYPEATRGELYSVPYTDDFPGIIIETNNRRKYENLNLVLYITFVHNVSNCLRDDCIIIIYCFKQKTPILR